MDIKWVKLTEQTFVSGEVLAKNNRNDVLVGSLGRYYDEYSCESVECSLEHVTHFILVSELLKLPTV